MYKILYNEAMKVGIFCNKETKRFRLVQEELFKALRARGVEYRVFDRVEEIGGIDVLAVLGGDGTILKVAIRAGKEGILLLGINAGTLGFLTEFEGNQVAEAAELLCGGGVTDCRSVLELDVGGKKFYALNDAVFQRRYDASVDDNVVGVQARIDGKEVDRFVGDGLIVSTPTGSTAYSLSAGGSVLTPDIAAFILTPICAHSLHNRPIVYADGSTLEVILSEEGGALSLFCDGKFSAELHRKDVVRVKKADFSVRFLKKQDSNFFDRLLFKLNKWSK